MEELARAVRRGVETRRRLLAAVEPTREFYEPRQPNSDDSWDYGTLLGSDLESKMASSYGLTDMQVDGLFADMREARRLGSQSSHQTPLRNSGSRKPLPRVGSLTFSVWPWGDGPLDRNGPGTLMTPLGTPSRLCRCVRLGCWLTTVGCRHLRLRLDIPSCFRRLGFSSIRRARTGTCLSALERVAAALWDRDWSGRLDDLRAALGGDLRVYARRRFFADHASVYSTDRRRARSDWPLQVRSRAWGIWVYGPAFSRDALYAVVHAARQRERQGVEVVSSLQRERSLGGVGRSLREVDRELTAESTLMEELRVFRVEATHL